MKRKISDKDFTDIDDLMEDWEKSGLDFLSFYKVYESSHPVASEEEITLENNPKEEIIVIGKVSKRERKSRKIKDKLDINSSIENENSVLEGQLTLFSLDTYQENDESSDLNPSFMHLKTKKKKESSKKNPILPIQLPLFDSNLLKL